MYRRNELRVSDLHIARQGRPQRQVSRRVSVPLLRQQRRLLQYLPPPMSLLIVCYAKCLDCTAGEKSSCTSCSASLLLWEGQCLSTCPSGSYTQAEEGLCKACVSPCETCNSSSSCLSCVPSYYLTSSTHCVSTCPADMYPEKSVRVCKDCGDMCINCTGPTSYDCVECNYKLGYIRQLDGSRLCYRPSCAEGNYLDVNLATKAVSCLPCHEACLTCSGGTADDCTACAPATKAYVSIAQNRYICKTCAQINPGLYTSFSKTCAGKALETNPR